VVIAAA
jgi:hypothetical protein